VECVERAQLQGKEQAGSAEDLGVNPEDVALVE
jgi:hypothetical protein